MKTLLNIDVTKLVNALNTAKPVTVQGQAALESVSAYVKNNALTAHGLNQCNQILAKQSNDIGLEDCVQAFADVLPTEKLVVALAYESMTNEKRKTILSASLEAINVVAGLYKHNSAQIIDEINAGALDSYKYNPVVSRLISFAKAARKDKLAQGFIGKAATNFSDVTYTLHPVITVQAIDDKNNLLALDGETYIQGARGGITPIKATRDLSLDSASIALLTALTITQPTDGQANILSFKGVYAKALDKAGFSSVKVDILGDVNDKVIIGDRKMSVDKFKALITVPNESLVAELVLTPDLRANLSECIKAIETLAKLSSSYIGYMYKFVIAGTDTVMYIGKLKKYNVVTNVRGVTIASSSYDNAFNVLSDNSLLSYPKVHKNIQELFADDLKSEEASMSSRKALLASLSAEHMKYEELRAKLNSDIETLELTPDANKEKLDALNVLRDKVESNLERTETAMKNIK